MRTSIQVVLGYLLADFVVACFHWFEDTYLDIHTKYSLLREIAINNELHHYKPRLIIIYNPLQSIRDQSIASVLSVCIISVIHRNMVFKYYSIWATFVIFVSLSNYIHQLAHLRSNEKHSIILFLQKLGLILSSDHHAVHHHSSPDNTYGVLNSYTNHIYDRLRIWRGLEFIIQILFRISPRPKPTPSMYQSMSGTDDLMFLKQQFELKLMNNKQYHKY